VSIDPQLPSPDDKKPVDYSDIESHERFDVGQVHGSIMREKQEPTDGAEPVPLWLVGLFAIVIFWGGFYLVWYSAGFKGNRFDERLFSRDDLGSAHAKVDPNDPKEIAKKGKKLFTANCVSCHQASGAGVPSQYPPLAGSEYVLGDPNQLAALVLYGLEGPITVKGEPYNGAMVAWSGSLKDDQIASILTYIRSEWGNKADPITTEQVASIRTAYAGHPVFTGPELAKVKAAPAVSASSGADSKTTPPKFVAPVPPPTAASAAH